MIFTVGMAHDTPVALLSDIPRAIQTMLEGEENVRFVRAHFKDISLASLGFEIVYDVLDPDYVVYMDVQQRLNLGICGLLEEREIMLARTVQMK